MRRQATTPPAPTTVSRKRRRGHGFFQSANGVWVIDLVYRGHRIRKRLGRGLSADVVKQIAQRGAIGGAALRLGRVDRDQ